MTNNSGRERATKSSQRPARWIQPRWLKLLPVALALGWVLGCVEVRESTSIPPYRFEFTEPQMGVPFRIVVYAPGIAQAEEAAKAAFGRVSALNQIMSDYETDSELNRLAQGSGKGLAVEVSPDLWAVLERSQALAKRTEGAFDVTIGPCVGLWRKARREGQLPEPHRLEEALERSGYNHMKLNSRNRTVTLLKQDMHLDLGGIAKGYALDEALKVLRDYGLGAAMVSGGGDMALGDAPPGRKGWRIEIAPLDAENSERSRSVMLSNVGVATSGDIFQRLEIGGKRYSHIVDPRTGVGLTDHSLVTVIARDAMTADSLATSVSVLGPEEGMALIENNRGAAGVIARMPGSRVEVFESKRMKQHAVQ